MDVTHETEIKAFYQDCGVFITGGTGTLGKLAIEKILRSCPGVRKIYVLIRPKKGFSVEERKKALTDNVVFDRMKSEQPSSVEKIVFVSGDCTAPRLGISDSDYHDVTQHVNIMIHLAATVRFDESLKVASNINVKGTQEVIKLCRDCLSFKAAVFVSTAYSNCIHEVVKEKFYDPPMDVEDLFALLDKLTPSEVDVLFPKLKGPWPNTYVFTKAMSENVILTQCKGVPASVVRPSMVTPTMKEPVPGWLDNMYGPIALFVGGGCGILRASLANEAKVMDLVPADFVANCIIAAALSSSVNDISVFNAGTSGNNPITLSGLAVHMYKMFEEKPLRVCIWYPFVFNIINYKIYMILAFFLHFLPGCLLDFALRLKNKPPMFLKIYRKIQKHNLLTSYFSTRDIKILTENTNNLYSALYFKDKGIFPFDMKVIDWHEYILNAGVDSRKYLMNGFLYSSEDGRPHIRRLYILHTVVKYVLYGIVLFMTWNILEYYVHKFFQH